MCIQNQLPLLRYSTSVSLPSPPVVLQPQGLFLSFMLIKFGCFQNLLSTPFPRAHTRLAAIWHLLSIPCCFLYCCLWKFCQKCSSLKKHWHQCSGITGQAQKLFLFLLVPVRHSAGPVGTIWWKFLALILSFASRCWTVPAGDLPPRMMLLPAEALHSLPVGHSSQQDRCAVNSPWNRTALCHWNAAAVSCKPKAIDFEV